MVNTRINTTLGCVNNPNCGCDHPFVVAESPGKKEDAMLLPMPDSDRLTREEMFKYYLAIDKQILTEAKKVQGSFLGLRGGELSGAEEILTQLIKTRITDAELDVLAEQGIDGLGDTGMGNIFKKVGGALKKAAQAVGKVVKKAAEAVKWVATLPVRVVVTGALVALKGPVAKGMVYAFIPKDSPVLNENPEVKRKKEKADNMVSILVDKLMFKEDYVLKHIRNAVVSHYNKSPEAVIHDIANKKDQELGAIDPATIITAGAGLIASVAGFAAVFKKENLPASTDWVQRNAQGQALADNQNISNDPAYGKVSFWRTPAGIATMVVGGLALAGGTYYVLND
jgi:hypothetical protein